MSKQGHNQDCFWKEQLNSYNLITLRETNSNSPWNKARPQMEIYKISSSRYVFSGASFSFREGSKPKRIF